MELISIIVPVYNVEKYLDRCVHSICNQTYSELEIILVNDGSTDSSANICEQWKTRDSRIRVITKQNGGLSSARNMGVEGAVGQYLMFVDSDDYILPDMVDKLYTAIIQQEADVSICNFQYVDEHGLDWGVNNNLPITDGVISGETILKEKMFESKNWYWVVAWNKLYRADVFRGIQYPIKKLHEDEFVIHKVMSRCEKVACVSDMLYCYVQRSDSIMGVKNKKDVRHLDAVEAYFCRSKFYQTMETYSDIVVKTLFKGIEEYQKIHCNNQEIVRNRDYRKANRKLQSQYRAIVDTINKSQITRTMRVRMYLYYLSLHEIWKLGWYKRKILAVLKRWGNKDGTK